MLSWFQAIMPKEARFFDHFESHARTLCAGAQALRQLLDGGEAVPEHAAAVARYESEADSITSTVMLLVRQSFITPFDRSDIIDLTSSMDDAIDQMHKTAKSVMLFEQRAFHPDMVRMGDIILHAANLTAEAIPLLRSMKSNASRLHSLTEQIVRLEEQSDQVADAGIAALYRGPAKKDPMAYIVGAEIFDHLEKVVDRFEDVANRVSGVLIEHL